MARGQDTKLISLAVWHLNSRVGWRRGLEIVSGRLRHRGAVQALEDLEDRCDPSAGFDSGTDGSIARHFHLFGGGHRAGGQSATPGNLPDRQLILRFEPQERLNLTCG